jgi:hypothetical protein
MIVIELIDSSQNLTKHREREMEREREREREREIDR